MKGQTVINNSWDYDNNTVTEWLRSGECNGCGECCRVRINLTVSKCEKDFRKGGKFTDNTGMWVEQQGRFWKVEVTDTPERDCFDLLGGKEGCNSTKSKICEVWPLHPSHTECFDSCSYAFIKLNEWEIEETA